MQANPDPNVDDLRGLIQSLDVLDNSFSHFFIPFYFASFAPLRFMILLRFLNPAFFTELIRLKNTRLIRCPLPLRQTDEFVLLPEFLSLQIE